MAKGFMVKGKDYVPEPDYPDGALYWEGDNVESVTGGWDGITSGGYFGGSVTFNPDSISVLTTTTAYADSTGLRSTNSINLTNYSTLKVEVNVASISASTPESYIQIVTNKTVSMSNVGSVAASSRQDGTGARTLTIDVSSLNSSYYVGLRFFKGSVTITRIYLEV